MFEVTNIICLKILSDLPQFGNSLAYCKCAVCENLLKGSSINRSKLCLDYIFLTLNKFLHTGQFFFFLRKKYAPAVQPETFLTLEIF